MGLCERRNGAFLAELVNVVAPRRSHGGEAGASPAFDMADKQRHFSEQLFATATQIGPYKVSQQFRAVVSARGDQANVTALPTNALSDATSLHAFAYRVVVERGRLNCERRVVLPHLTMRAHRIPRIVCPCSVHRCERRTE